MQEVPYTCNNCISMDEQSQNGEGNHRAIRSPIHYGCSGWCGIRGHTEVDCSRKRCRPASRDASAHQQRSSRHAVETGETRPISSIVCECQHTEENSGAIQCSPIKTVDIDRRKVKGLPLPANLIHLGMRLHGIIGSPTCGVQMERGCDNNNSE